MVAEFYDWADVRAELHDGDDEALAAEQVRTEAWVVAYRRDSVGPGQSQGVLGDEVEDHLAADRGDPADPGQRDQ